MAAHQKRRQWNEDNIVLNPDVRPSYGLSTFNGNSAWWVRKQRIDFFCVVSTEVLMHFFFSWLTTDGVAQGGDGGIHTLLFIDLLYENVFFAF